MKPSARWLAPCLVFAAFVTPALAGGNANFLLGGRGLDEDFWEPAESQDVFGVTVDFGKDAWPINLEIGAYASATEEDVSDPLFGSGEFSGSVSELTFGVIKLWKTKGKTRPFFGGGVASVVAEADLDTSLGDADDDDNSVGAYVHGGVFWRLGQRFNLGLDARVLVGTDITLFGAEGDADYFQLGLLLGWGWPAGK